MSECSCEFESKINVQCGLAIVRIVRSGEAIEKRAELLKHAGCLIGCLGAYLDGGEEQTPFATAGELPQELEACCDEVEAQLSGEAYSVNPLVVSLLLKLAELVIRKYLR